jgi:uncharacterized protein (TIGR03435 family)
MIPTLANHLWQSTLFAAVAGLLTLALRNNHARTRHWIWLTASVKFLIPFALLVGIGSQLGWRTAPASPQVSLVIDEISQPFTTPPTAAPRSMAIPVQSRVPAILFAAWLCGFAGVISSWCIQLRRIRATVRAASPLAIHTPIPALSSPALLEPGVFGIRRPVLLLPEGIADRLTPSQLQAVIAHELCHVRRHDNLTAAIHMLVQAIFWFHPLVWWMGARLVEERERACDEDVLQRGAEPQVYAESILKVCKFYIESPLACVSGVTGASLKKRIEGIMTPCIVQKLNLGKKLLLAALATAAVAGPIVVGIVNAPHLRAQPQSAVAFDTASVKSRKPEAKPGANRRMRVSPEGITYTDVTLSDSIQAAYGVRRFQVTGPDWIASARYDIVAKAAGPVPGAQLKLMLQALLSDRFKLTLHRETKELAVYAMVPGKKGPKFHDSEGEGESRIYPDGGTLVFKNYSMPALADFLGRPADRPVLDKTGLGGHYDFSIRLVDGESPNPSDVKRAAADWQSIFTDLQEQLGLKLEAQKAAIEILVIDHAEKVPTEN